jgi:hypothetical protein
VENLFDLHGRIRPQGNKAMAINKRRYKKGPLQRARLLVKRKRREELRKMRAELRRKGG